MSVGLLRQEPIVQKEVRSLEKIECPERRRRRMSAYLSREPEMHDAEPIRLALDRSFSIDHVLSVARIMAGAEDSESRPTRFPAVP